MRTQFGCVTLVGRRNRMTEKKIGKRWFVYGRKRGFGIGFDISKYGINLELGFWYAGVEF
jgi:hypothetical protein